MWAVIGYLHALREAVETAEEGWGYAPGWSQSQWCGPERVDELARIAGMDERVPMASRRRR